MGLFSGAAKGGGNSDFRDRLMAAIGVMQGDQNAPYRYAELHRQNQELQLRQQAAQRTEQDRADQVWGAKESGVGNPLISALSSSDLSQTLRERYAPHSVSPDATYVTPSLTPGGQDSTFTAPSAPTEYMKNRAALGTESPALGEGFARRQAFGPDITVPAGGGVATHDANGAMTWGVQPFSVAPSPAAQGAPTTGGQSSGANNNPGGLRVPGSTQFQHFTTPAAGIQRQEQILGGPGYVGGGNNTIRGIVERYAPRRSRGGDNSDQQVDNYIARVSRSLGIQPDQPLSAADVPRLGAAMREVETGHPSAISSPVANAPRIGASPANGNRAQLMAQARAAIAHGANPAAVAAHLRQLGVQ